MHSTGVKRALVQCDFDGTITEEDVSFLLLDAFADGDWRRLLTQYREGKISVNYFNTHAFAMVKADRQSLLKFVRGRVKIRDGVHELITYCQKRGFQFVVVSNGLGFYIEAVLRDIGVGNVRIFAAQNRFGPRGVETWYVGPDGDHMDSGFKEAYIRSFLRQGYRVVYVGNGISDVSPARQAHYIFATGELLVHCKQQNLQCIPFVDLNDVVKELESLPLG